MKVSRRSAAGEVLRRLWTELAGWLGRRIHCAQDREDIAGECIVRAWRTFGESPPPWPILWSWATRVARSIMLERLRRAQTMVVELQDELVRVACRCSPELSLAAEVSRLGDGLSRDIDRLALQMLASGASASDVAHARGVTVRAVSASISRIKRRWAELGK